MRLSRLKVKIKEIPEGYRELIPGEIGEIIRSTDQWFNTRIGDLHPTICAGCMYSSIGPTYKLIRKIEV